MVNSFDELCVVIRDQYDGDPDEVLDYFGDTYIGGFRRNASWRPPLFPIELWNMFNQTAEELPRTNNIEACRAYSKNLGQRFDIGQKGHFFTIKGHFFWKKGPKNPPPYSTPFLSILHQNKALHNCCKRGQRSIVERTIGIEYALAWHNSFQVNVSSTSPTFWKCLDVLLREERIVRITMLQNQMDMHRNRKDADTLITILIHIF